MTFINLVNSNFPFQPVDLPKKEKQKEKEFIYTLSLPHKPGNQPKKIDLGEVASAIVNAYDKNEIIKFNEYEKTIGGVKYHVAEITICPDSPYTQLITLKMPVADYKEIFGPGDLEQLPPKALTPAKPKPTQKPKNPISLKTALKDGNRLYVKGDGDTANIKIYNDNKLIYSETVKQSNQIEAAKPPVEPTPDYYSDLVMRNTYAKIKPIWLSTNGEAAYILLSAQEIKAISTKDMRDYLMMLADRDISQIPDSSNYAGNYMGRLTVGFQDNLTAEMKKQCEAFINDPKNSELNKGIVQLILDLNEQSAVGDE